MSNVEVKICTVIDGTGKSSPPDGTIINNENSTRALSKKNRIYVLREFLHRMYPSTSHQNPKILDVAGGRGDLSWILKNIDGINSIIADPRVPNHKRLVKSVRFLLDNPAEAKIRAVEGLPTHQPLAKFLTRMIENCSIKRKRDNEESVNLNLSSPNYMRIHVDDALVNTIRNISLKKDLNDGDKNIWNEYWQKESDRVQANKVYYGGTLPKQRDEEKKDMQNLQIKDPAEALCVFQSLDLIVGFHPDQATEATIDLALLLKIPFAVV